MYEKKLIKLKEKIRNSVLNVELIEKEENNFYNENYPKDIGEFITKVVVYLYLYQSLQRYLWKRVQQCGRPFGSKSPQPDPEALGHNNEYLYVNFPNVDGSINGRVHMHDRISKCQKTRFSLLTLWCISL